MLSEFRFAARALARWRGGAIAAVLTLAIGIGATTGLYAFVQVILPDLPGVPELDRIARIYASSQSLGVERSPVALNEFDTALSRATSFAAVGAYAEADAAIGTSLDVQPVVVGHATPGFFTAMGVPPAAGRVFAASDLEPARPVVILSDALWRRRFPDGPLDHATIAVDGVDRTVVGVMPPQFSYGIVGIGADLWIPLGHPSLAAPAIVTVFGRLRPGVGWTAAATELRALSRGGQWTWRAIPIETDTRSRALSAYAFTLGPALLILLIACVNVACMLMARGFERDKELSVRRALGATRFRVIRLLLTENVLLAAISGAIGGGLAIAILRMLARSFATVQPALASHLAADTRLLPVAMVASALACLLFGTTPALRLTRRDVAASLNGVPPAHRIQIAGYGGRDAIVFTEIASAVGLIVWTAMTFTLFAQLRGIKFTFPADHVVAMRVPEPDARNVAARLAAVPGVTRTAVTSGMLGGGDRVRVTADGAAPVVMARVPIGEGVLETLGLPVIRGRAFDASELRGGAGVVMLSESAARDLAPGGEALGLHVQLAGRGPHLLVIGVCRDAIDYGALSQAGAFAPSEIYVPYEPRAPQAVILARVATDPHLALRAIAAAAQAPAGTRPPRPVVLSDDVRDHSRDSGVVLTRILGGFAVLTLLLAASGVFAVISQSVTQRTREFGIRMALGAPPRRVLRMVLARESKLIGTAIAVGVIFTMALARALFVELARLSAIVPSLWIAALVLSSGIAAIAAATASYRIVRLAPSAVLRRN